METLLNFKGIEIKDKALIRGFYEGEQGFLCEHNFTDLFIWQMEYNTKFAVYNGYIYVKYTTPSEHTAYVPPVGAKEGFLEAFEILKNEAERTEGGIRLFSVMPWQKELLEKKEPEKCELKYSRDSASYIYLSEDLIGLHGKKYHGKKNHLNKFMKDFEDRWRYEDLNENNKEEFYDFQLKWCSLHDSAEFEGETKAVRALLDNVEELDVKGGLIKIDGETAAMTLGAAFSPETFIINIEKALPDINGAYQIINNEFAARNLSGYKYINREEDLGIDGLRQAKLSYHPVYMGDAYEGFYYD